LLRTISSRSARIREQFDAELLAPIIIAGKVMFPKSTRVRGHVAESRRSLKTGDQEFLRITLDAIQMLDGGWVDMDTTSVSARSESSRSRILDLPGARRGSSFGRPDSGSVFMSEAIVSADRKLQFAVLQRIVMGR
jgi:hypothetical protein